MTLHERDAWNQRYREGSHTEIDPDPLLVSAYDDYILPLQPRPGRALDLAGGAGRHALWLAQRGWSVDLIDISEEALARADRLAAAPSPAVHTIRHDLSDGLPSHLAHYDLVLNFFFLERSLLTQIPALLAAGAILVFKTYTDLHPSLSGGKGPRHPMHLLHRNELLRAFAGLDLLFYRETVRERGTAELISRSPSCAAL